MKRPASRRLALSLLAAAGLALAPALASAGSRGHGSHLGMRSAPKPGFHLRAHPSHGHGFHHAVVPRRHRPPAGLHRVVPPPRHLHRRHRGPGTVVVIGNSARTIYVSDGVVILLLD